MNTQIEEAIHAYLYLKPLNIEDSFKRGKVKKKKGKNKKKYPELDFYQSQYRKHPQS